MDDLHRLLANAGLSTAIILAGHSSAGLHARLYAYTHPDEVAGLVLVDPSREDQTGSFRRLDPQKRSPAEWEAQVLQPSLALRRDCIRAFEQGVDVGSEVYRECGFPQYPQLDEKIQRATNAFQMTIKFQRAQLSEEESVFHESADQLRAARRPLGSLPVIVLTSGRPPAPAAPLDAEEAALREARYQAWKGLGAKAAAISSDGEQRVVPGAGHDIPLEHPDAVIEALEAMLAKVRCRQHGG